MASSRHCGGGHGIAARTLDAHPPPIAIVVTPAPVEPQSVAEASSGTHPP